MKDQLISFKTAKLAKEKGFNWRCYAYYKNNFLNYGRGDYGDNIKNILWNYNKPLIKHSYLEIKDLSLAELRIHWNNPEINDSTVKRIRKEYLEELSICSAPTQSLLQKWLREEIGIYIQIEASPTMDHDIRHTCFLHDPQIECQKIYSGKKYKKTQIEDEWDTYEEALEAGLFEALKLIK